MGKKKKQPTDLECMGNDRRWGLWPYLPIKRTLKDQSVPEFGLLWAYDVARNKHNKTPISVFGAFVYRLPPTREDFLATKKLEYANLEDLVAEGWIIDD